ncbi:hypothetical protein IQ268_00680 [Oculatella sp. LEGE 06141]|uniref:DUF6391 domain-containing protein n=1 Tax=Oculatella sp. LEGE 06141 TaxID=1828648 RepID=UPI0018828D8B|nr:DUF6391 domain-containing protein [Oculatella sp. LEGE 06141]MBE9177089.1 hypothetical protein [Oculatella sp. LEGE 06141]
MVATGSAQASSFPFDFAPQPTQDADLLTQLQFVPGLKEILMLRQVHALEHATVWMLSEMASSRQSSSQEYDSISGMSTEEGFYLYGRVSDADLHQAVHLALHRMVNGEWDLAVHPRCGTNLSVGLLMTAGLAVGVTLLLPKGPIEQLLGLGLAATAAVHVSPDLGSIAQRYVTTAIPFNLAIADIRSSGDHGGRPVHFVRVRWTG